MARNDAGLDAVAFLRAVNAGDDEAADVILGCADLPALARRLAATVCRAVYARADSLGVSQDERRARLDAHLLELLRGAQDGEDSP